MDPHTQGATGTTGGFDKQVSTHSPIGEGVLGDRDRQTIDLRFAFVPNPNMPSHVTQKVTELQANTKKIATAYYGAVPDGFARNLVLDKLSEAWLVGKGAIEAAYQGAGGGNRS